METPNSNIELCVTLSELNLLLKYAKQARLGIVEIGVFKGETSKRLIKASTVNIYGIDPIIPYVVPPYEVGNANKISRNTGFSSRYKFHKDYSYNVAKTFNAPFDFIFIDGSHEYSDVKRDFEDWFPKLENGGYMAFHDSNRENLNDDGKWRNGWAGPTKLVRELKEINSLTFVESADSLSVFKKIKIDEIRWNLAKEREQKNWNECIKKNEIEDLREISLRRYLDVMELVRGQDLKGAKVLDIGAGYTSILPTFTNYGVSTIVDPSYPYKDIVLGYANKKIIYVCRKAEDFEIDEEFDEVWIYNVLKHVLDPDAILDKLPGRAKLLRIAEITDDIIDEAHPYVIKPEWLSKKLESISEWCRFHSEDRWFPQPKFGDFQLKLFGGVCKLK